MDFTDSINKVLKALSMNQTALAAKLGVSRGIVSEFASGAREPSKEFMFGLSKLGISLDWFLTGEGEMFLKSPEKALVKTDKTGLKLPVIMPKENWVPGEWRNNESVLYYRDIISDLSKFNVEGLLAIQVQDTAMLGAGIRFGDLVLFNPDEAQDIYDGIHVIAFKCVLCCRRLEIDIDKTKVFSVRYADLDKAEFLGEVGNGDKGKLEILGRVYYWIHQNTE